jgi:hypothetical protein
LALLIFGVLFTFNALSSPAKAPAAMAGDAGASASAKPSAAAGGEFKAFKVYTDANSPDNHYAPSGWMGDWGDLKLNVSNFDNPHSGTTSLQVIYTPKRSQGANWAGIYWQNPPNNWGGRPGGYDITGAKKFIFWARGEKGGEIIYEFRVGGLTGEYPDSDIAGFGPVKLNKEWTKYEIDLTDKDLSSIIGGFMWSANLDNNPEGFTIYFDDMRYE